MAITIQDALWKDYAAVRWSARRSRLMRTQFDDAMWLIYGQLESEAKAHGGALAFTERDLWEMAIGALHRSCEYCATVFGVESFGVTRRNPLLYNNGNLREQGEFRLGGYAVCCHACAQGHRDFTDQQWLDLLAVLRKCEEPVAKSAVAALGGRRYFPAPRRPRITREPRKVCSKRLKT